MEILAAKLGFQILRFVKVFRDLQDKRTRFYSVADPSVCLYNNTAITQLSCKGLNFFLKCHGITRGADGMFKWN